MRLSGSTHLRSAVAVGFRCPPQPTAATFDEVIEDLLRGLAAHVIREERQSLADHQRPIRLWPPFLSKYIGNPIGFSDVGRQQARGDDSVHRTSSLRHGAPARVASLS